MASQFGSPRPSAASPDQPHNGRRVIRDSVLPLPADQVWLLMLRPGPTPCASNPLTQQAADTPTSSSWRQALSLPSQFGWPARSSGIAITGGGDSRPPSPRFLDEPVFDSRSWTAPAVDSGVTGRICPAAWSDRGRYRLADSTIHRLLHLVRPPAEAW
jgi:hypothetical protein